MADTVMRMPDPALGGNFFKAGDGIQRKCKNCEEEDHLVRRKESGEGVPEPSAAVEQALSSSGQSLDTHTRSFMEQRFGQDFSQVQIHNDGVAHQSSADIEAKAYTHGNHIVFGAGHYQPDTEAGKHLLAHELTHVVQQGGGGTSIQRAENDVAHNCAKLKDSKSDINSFVNQSLADVRKTLGKSAKPRAIADALHGKMAKSDILHPGRSAIELWADTLPADKQNLPAASSTKYKGITYELWATSGFGGSFEILNPTMKVNGICIGSDKLGHFFEQGYDYFEIVNDKGGSAADAQEFGERTEGGGFGLSMTGVFSNADLQANRKGFQFYTDLMANSGLTFDISKYITDQWDETINTNFYEDDPKVAPVVWSNLLTRDWTGSYTGHGGAKSEPMTLKLSVNSSGVATGNYEVTRKGKKVMGTITNGKITFNKTKVKGVDIVHKALVDKNPVSGISIDFEWKEGSDSGLGHWDSKGESQLNGTWGKGKSADNGGKWSLK